MAAVVGGYKNREIIAHRNHINKRVLKSLWNCFVEYPDESKAMTSEQRRGLLKLFGHGFSELRGVPVAMNIPPVQDDGFQKFVLAGGKERDGTVDIIWGNRDNP